MEIETKTLSTANEILMNAGLNYQVNESMLYDANGNVLPDHKAIIHENGHVFQVAKKGYQVIQNSESLSLLDEVVSSGLAKYSGAKSFKNGAVVMVRAEVPMDYVVAGDEIKTYLHVITSHDGSVATTIVAHQQRLICQNIINGGLKGQDCYTRFKHTQNYKLRIEEAKEIFAHYRVIFQRQKEAFETMAKTQMSNLELDSFLNNLLNVKNIEEESTRKINQKQDLERLFVEGKGHQNPQIAGSQWCAYNAVTEYVDHYRSTKGDASNREYASILGSGAKMREKAFALLTR